MVAEAVIEVREAPHLVEALSLIDEGLSRLQGRELISANEVADLLLDVRTLLVVPGAPLDAPNDPLGDDSLPVTTN